MKSIDYVIIINTASKGVTSGLVKQIQSLIAARSMQQVSSRVLLTTGSDINKVLRQARTYRPKYIIACGGDGTVRAVAEYAVNQNCIMGVIPAGTLNHFARSMHLPQNIDSAVSLLFQSHKIVQLDVGSVNGKVFVNNSSVGMYSKLVKKRERWQQKYPKSVALLLAAVWQLFHIKKMHYIVRSDFFDADGKFSLIIIGNGDYIFKKGAFRRTANIHSTLSVYMFGGSNVYQMVRSLIHLVFGKKYAKKAFLRKSVDTISLRTSKQSISVALDGEVVSLATPLNYSVRTNALSIITPKKGQ